jgi:hypothetical protein
MKEECPEFDYDFYKSFLCPWCGQEIEKCKYNWERFHIALWDPYCYDNMGNRIGIAIPGELPARIVRGEKYDRTS